jgi:hypothetical protein
LRQHADWCVARGAANRFPRPVYICRQARQVYWAMFARFLAANAPTGTGSSVIGKIALAGITE